MSLLKTINFIANHPLNRHAKQKAFLRFLKWQIGCRLVPGPVLVNFVNTSRLLVKKSMHGATMSLYTGLQEFEDMAFILHALKKDDLFVDIGANVGTYTILAGTVIGAQSIAVEPIPETYRHLLDNITINNSIANITALNIALGDEIGDIRLTTNLDSTNHVVSNSSPYHSTSDIPINTLDAVLNNLKPAFIKIDVEGYEMKVLSGGTKAFESESLLGVILEVNNSGLRYGFSDSDLHNKMLEFGFKPYSYLPASKELLLLERSNQQKNNTLYLKNVEEISRRIKNAPTFTIQQTETTI